MSTPCHEILGTHLTSPFSELYAYLLVRPAQNPVSGTGALGYYHIGKFSCSVFSSHHIELKACRIDARLGQDVDGA